MSLLSGSRAATENDVASRQQKSLGTVIDCRSVKGGYHCSYTFPVDGDQYKGDCHSHSNWLGGNTVVVYYDPQDLRTTALEDFSAQSRKDRQMVYVLLLMMVAAVAYIFYARAIYRDDSKARTI